MSTWRMFPGDRNEFRWESIDQQLGIEEAPDAMPEDTRRLPSMADLLLLGSSQLLENGRRDVEEKLFFRTGLGKCVELKKSSIARARSVLGDVGCTLTDAGRSFEFDACPLYGRESGITSFGPISEMNLMISDVMSKSGLHSASENVVNASNSMFKTGSGQAVQISSAGLVRAKALLKNRFLQSSLFRSIHFTWRPSIRLI